MAEKAYNLKKMRSWDEAQTEDNSGHCGSSSKGFYNKLLASQDIQSTDMCLAVIGKSQLVGGAYL